MAQSVSGSIRGTVVDSEGFSVPGASVTIKNEATGQTTSTTSSDGGFFNASGLPVGGPYTVTVTAASYKSTAVKDVYLTIGEPLRIEITMTSTDATVASEEVTVIGVREANPAIDERGVGAQFDAESIRNLPTVNRDIKEVVQQSPLAYIDFGDTDSPLSIAGANPRCNAFLVDGLPQNDSFGLNRGGYPTARGPLPFDWAKQIQVAVSPYDTEYNDFCGGVINIVTKSGENDFHGSAYYYFKDDSLRGNKSKELTTNPIFEEKTYGATFSGPIIEDTLFFFLGYDKIERVTPISIGPGEGAAANTFTFQVPGVSQQDIDDIASIAKNKYGFDPMGLASGFTEENERWFAKLNWNINNQHRVALSYQRVRGGTLSTTTQGTPAVSSATAAGKLALASNWYLDAEDLDAFTIQIFSDWTDRFSTEFRAGRVKVKGNQLPLGGNEFPEVWVRTNGVDNITNNADDSYVVFGPDFSRQYNYMDYTFDQYKLTGTYDLDEHVIRGGLELKKLDVYNAFVQGARGTYRFNSIADFNNGILASANDSRTNVTPGTYSIQYNNAFTNNPDDAAALWGYDLYSVYLQDDWDVNSQFSLMAGVRYDWFSSRGNIPLNTGFTSTYGFPNTGDLSGKSIFLPRFSFSYDFEIPEDEDLSLTVRGGVGRYSGGSPNVWISNNYNSTGNILTSIQGYPGQPIAAGSGINFPAANFIGTAPVNFDLFPVPAALQSALTTRAGAGVVNALDPDFKIASTWRFNIGLDGDWAGYKFTVEYLKMVGKDQLFWKDLRQGAPGNIAPVNAYDLPAPDAALGRVRYDSVRLGGTGSAARDIILTNVDAGESQFIVLSGQKSWDMFDGAGGIDLAVGYTWSDVTDIGGGTSSVANSNLTNRAYTNLNDPELARSDFERRHRYTMNLGLKYSFFEGYETRFNFFSVRMSGQPFSYVFASGATGTAGFGQNQQNGANLFYVPKADSSGVVTATSDPIIAYTAGTTPAQIAAFDSYLKQTGLSEYTGKISPRNEFFGPWSSRIDFSAEQDITVFDDHKITLEFDIFNLTNLLNKNWGRFTSITFPPTANVINTNIVQGGTNGCTAAATATCYLYDVRTLPAVGARESVADASYWQIQVGIRYDF
ncbi:hypothetical protein sos41_14140 [Alphaproteobacteria bacterium SO-S41]|nr:hypothetical protein sos41_14140 [Alphaproteobacteria bacterium SO-S41]